MRRNARIILLILAIALMLSIPADAVLVPYHAPTLTVITENAPRDTQMKIKLYRGDHYLEVEMTKKTRAWEQQFRLFREAVLTIPAWFGNSYDLKDAQLVIITGGEEEIMELPRELTDRMTGNDVVIYDYQRGTFHLGDPFWRGPLMLLMRILVAMVIELIIFRLFNFVQGRSFVSVAISSLATYGLLNLYTFNWLQFDNRAIVPYIVFFFMLVVAQIVFNVIVMEEESKDKVTGTTIVACFVSLLSNVLMLTLLPV